MKNLGNFSISEYAVTKEIWDSVRLWAAEHGYNDLSEGSGKGKKPVGNITWFDAVKFTNALSELAGLEPCYYINGEIYRNGRYELCEKDIKDSGGYRLPSASEWEYACRGGTETDYFWGDEYIPMPKNEYGWCGIATEKCITHEVGLLKPNQYGLYDMSGNVHEWCFDNYKKFFRIMMGGSVAFDSIAKSGFHTFTSPYYSCYETGMRIASSNPDAEGYETQAKKSGFFGEYVKPTIKYTDMSYPALAERLFAVLGDTDEAMYIKEAVCEPEEMLKRFRDLFVKRLKENEVNENIHTSGQDFEKHCEEFLNYDFNIRWYGKSGDRDCHHLIDKPSYMGVYYAKTKDERYLKKSMELYYSMLVRHKAEFDVMDDEMLSQKHQTEQSWAWNNGFESATRAMGILTAFWNAVNAGCDINFLPADVVAGIALFIMCENLYTTIKDGRINIFNQVCHTSRALLKIAKVYSDFKISETVKEIAQERIKQAMMGSTRKDGSPLEQSYMYNGAIISTYHAVKNLIEDEETLNILNRTNTMVERYLAAAVIPTGGFPALSTSGSEYPPDMSDKELLQKHKEKMLNNYAGNVFSKMSWPEKDRIINALLKDCADVPKYKNIHFPYGGITILRSGWSYTSQMIYFFSAPPGRGHAGSNINEIQLWDYGMPMLINAGGHSYKIREYFPESQADIIDDIDSYQHSSYSRNTVTSGSNQKRLANGENNLKIDMHNPCGYKYYESENYVYTEGIYTDGYVLSGAGTHKRQIIYMKKNKLLFVADTVDSKEEEEFFQCWNFMPKADFCGEIGFKRKYPMWGYTDEEITADEDKSIIYTKSSTAPNIYLYQFSSENMCYERKKGELDPAAGWLAPAIQSERVPKTDIRAKWKSKGKTSVLTVIETSPDNVSHLKNIEKSEDGFRITGSNGESIKISCTNNGDINFSAANDEIVINSGGESYVFENGRRNELKSPVGFEWKDEDGYSAPIYKY